MRGAVREASSDLDQLLAAARVGIVRVPDPERRAAELTTSLLANLPWDRVMLASVLGVALVRLADVAEAEAEARAVLREPGDTPGGAS